MSWHRRIELSAIRRVLRSRKVSLKRGGDLLAGAIAAAAMMVATSVAVRSSLCCGVAWPSRLACLRGLYGDPGGFYRDKGRDLSR
jgi:hypothetical protein